MFLGMINFYRDMWPRRSHILAPLNKLAGIKSNKQWVWEEIHQTSFLEAKEMLSKEALLAFPDFNKPFHVYTDASDRQLGATVVQDGKPLGFYTRKLNSAQMNYTTQERELLGIVEGMKAFEGVLFGQDITIHTDHLNILYAPTPSQRIVRWRMMLEEFAPRVLHVAGKENDAADALSRLEMDPKANDTVQWEQLPPPLTYSDEMEQRVNMLFPLRSEEEAEPESGFPLAPDSMRFHQQQDPVLKSEPETKDSFTTKRWKEKN